MSDAVRAGGAWERNGFRVVTEQRSTAFEALFGCPGAKLLAQDL